MTIATPLAEALCVEDLVADASPSRPAIVDTDGRGLSFGELTSVVRDTDRVLAALGVPAGAVVATRLSNGPATAALMLALLCRGVVAPISQDATNGDVALVLRNTRAMALIEAEHLTGPFRSDDVVRLELRPLAQAPGAFELRPRGAAMHHSASGEWHPSPDDVALLLHTSGTTVEPKLVPLTHRALCLSASAVAESLALTGDDRLLSVMPLFHIHGLVAGLLAPLSVGGTMCSASGFHPTAFQSLLASSHATWYSGTPAMHEAVLARFDTRGDRVASSNLRLIRSSSSPLARFTLDRLEAAFGVPVLNAYGMTEAAHQITSVSLADHATRRYSVGLSRHLDVAIKTDRGVEAEPGEAGEIVLRGPQLMAGYLRPDGANAAAFRDGWFRTGDVGSFDHDGALLIHGRSTEFINCGGEKISPYEVEAALLAHPAVAEAVAFPMPHPRRGEIVAAAVVTWPGCEVGEHALLRTLRDQLTRSKVPRRIVFVPRIPRGATGKVSRRRMSELMGDRLRRG